jgi:hypothetical protein
LKNESTLSQRLASPPENRGHFCVCAKLIAMLVHRR